MFIDALKNAPRKTTFNGVECMDILKEQPESLALLDAASQLSSIPIDVSIPSTAFYMRQFTDDELKKVFHLLGLMVDREVVVRYLEFSQCSINSPSIVSLLRFIPHSGEVSFIGTQPSECTMVKLGRCLQERSVLKLKTIAFNSCQLSDSHLAPILPHLVHIEYVGLGGNPNITTATYESLVDVVKRTNKVRMRELIVDNGLMVSVKKMFVQYPQINIE